ncbi:MAG: penicillin-binding protein 1A, partial [Acidobacteria bacterium]
MEIRPGPASFFEGGPIREGPAVLEFHEGKLASISSLEDGSSLEGYWLEPEVITTLFDQSRAKRRLVRYDDLPQDCVDAVLAAEDHRFFSHHGVSLYRILGAAVADIRADERAQGGSTLTMQLARTFFLSRRKTLSRKVEEVLLALLMEQRLSKRQIFELYANQAYLGQRGSFSVYGFGEAADAYFNKDVKSLTLPEAALLAALIRGPNLYSPYKNPKRAIDRRNWVLHRMSEDGLVSAADAERASKAPLQLAQQNLEGSQAPFFVDMVKDQLLAQFPERDLVSQSFRIYTTLDLDLQRAASDAVRAGMVEVDRELAKKKRPKGAPPPEPNQPQVALVTLDPHTGELKALVGGRDYGVSQLDHVLARRPPGSSFKPFVYAAALNSGVNGSQPVITPATILMDEPTTFTYEGGTYDPGNYKQEYHGAVTVREALNQSLNVATVRLAEMVGYDRIRKLAIDAGMNKDLLATPALALGAYVATPLEIAGAYTVFANDGQYVGPKFILAVNDVSGRNLLETSQTRRQVLDSRVNYLMVNLMESVINNGTAAGVRSRGFTLPAAGKTGTSHDGWFAGFTSNLLA